MSVVSTMTLTYEFIGRGIWMSMLCIISAKKWKSLALIPLPLGAQRTILKIFFDGVQDLDTCRQQPKNDTANTGATQALGLERYVMFSSSCSPNTCTPYQRWRIGNLRCHDDSCSRLGPRPFTRMTYVRHHSLHLTFAVHFAWSDPLHVSSRSPNAY